MNLLSGSSFDRMLGALQAAETRQKVISNNIANADTPKFKRSELLFEELLERSLNKDAPTDLRGRRTDAKHIAIGYESSNVPRSQLVTDTNTSMNNNENNVDIDREMSLLAKNQLNYNLYIQQVNHQISMMRTAIEGRG